MPTQRCRPIAESLATMIDPVFDRLGPLADSLADCIRAFDDDGPTRRHIALLQPRLRSELQRGGALLRGIGFALAPEVLMDARLWIDWWVGSAAGSEHAVAFDFDEDSLDYYDYTIADWFVAPRQGVRRSLVGPYVDFSGLNDYIVTATVPVTVGGRFIGAAGADLHVAEIERRLYAANRTVGGEALILNSCNRIVASTSARHVVGSLFRPTGTTAGSQPQQQLADLPWSVLTLR